MGGQVVGRRPCRERGGDRSVWGRGGSRGRGRVGGRTIVKIDIEFHVVWIRSERHVELRTGGVAVDKDDVDSLKVLKESVEVAEVETTADVIATLGE